MLRIPHSNPPHRRPSANVIRAKDLRANGIFQVVESMVFLDSAAATFMVSAKSEVDRGNSGIVSRQSHEHVQTSWFSAQVSAIGGQYRCLVAAERPLSSCGRGATGFETHDYFGRSRQA